MTETDKSDNPRREPEIKVWVDRDRQASDQRALLAWVADDHPTVEHVETVEGFPPGES